MLPLLLVGSYNDSNICKLSQARVKAKCLACLAASALRITELHCKHIYKEIYLYGGYICFALQSADGSGMQNVLHVALTKVRNLPVGILRPQLSVQCLPPYP